MPKEEDKGTGGSAGKVKKKETRGKPRLREASSGLNCLGIAWYTLCDGPCEG